MFTVYAIYNEKHDKIYVGQTKDLKERLELHNSGKFQNSYTAMFDGGWQLIYSEEVLNRSLALLREKQLKSHRGREFTRSKIKT